MTLSALIIGKNNLTNARLRTSISQSQKTSGIVLILENTDQITPGKLDCNYIFMMDYYGQNDELNSKIKQILDYSPRTKVYFVTDYSNESVMEQSKQIGVERIVHPFYLKNHVDSLL